MIVTMYGGSANAELEDKSCPMKFKFRFSILAIMALTTVIAHTGAKRHFASRLATSSGTVHSTWIPFVIEVCVPEPMPMPFDTFSIDGVTANGISTRRYVGLCGMYTMVSTKAEVDFSKPILLNGYHYHNRNDDSTSKVSSP